MAAWASELGFKVTHAMPSQSCYTLNTKWRILRQGGRQAGFFDD